MRFGVSTLRETLTIITTQSSIVEGSRLQKRGRVSASILACTNTLQSNFEPKSSEPLAPGEVRIPHRPCAASYIGESYDIIARPAMSQRRHIVTSLVFMTLHHDDISNCARLPMPRISNLTHARQQARACKILPKVPCMSHICWWCKGNVSREEAQHRIQDCPIYNECRENWWKTHPTNSNTTTPNNPEQEEN